MWQQHRLLRLLILHHPQFCPSQSEVVTITGTNFTSASAVSFNGTAAASYTVNSATEIVATMGAGASGAISVTTPGGTANSSSSLTVNTPPAAVTVTGAGTYCDNTTLSASNGSDGTIYWQTTTGGTSTANSGTTSPTYSATGTYYARARSSAVVGVRKTQMRLP